jgi:hypothetical protein
MLDPQLSMCHLPSKSQGQTQRDHRSSAFAVQFLFCPLLELYPNDIQLMYIILFFFRLNSRGADLSVFAQELVTLRFWVVTLGCVLLGAVGIGLEIAAAISKDNGGVSPRLFDSWPCADPTYYARLPRRPEKCIFLRVGSVFNCERLTPAIRALLIIRTIQVIFSRSALYSAFAHGQSFRLGYSTVECTQNPYVLERLASYD